MKISELIARDLADSIIREGLEEGARLAPEKEMLAELGVARATLREALRLLESSGVITMRAGPNGGPVVRRPRPSDLQDGLTLHLQFGRASLEDVLTARFVLEPPVAALAAARMTPAELDELEETVERILDHPEDEQLFLEENARFHSLVAGASKNLVLIVFIDSLKAIADGARAGVQYPEAHRRAVAHAHQRVVDALREKDADKASNAMMEHLREAERYWTTHYRHLVEQPVAWSR